MCGLQTFTVAQGEGRKLKDQLCYLGLFNKLRGAALQRRVEMPLKYRNLP